MNGKREYWIDYIKVFACILVVLGHFFQFMVKASIWAYKVDNSFLSFVMGLLVCLAVFMIVYGMKEAKGLTWFAKYTMPIFLIHTLFAASYRVLLMKLGISGAALQVILGISVSFAGPIVAMMILKKIKLDFLVYLERLIKRM